MLERTLERGHLKAGWVAGDDAFGMSPSFRDGLAALGMHYVLDVPGGITVWPLEPAWASPAYQGRGAPRKPRLVGGQRRTMGERSDDLPADAWREITVAEGSQGPRSYLFSAQRVRPTSRRKPGGIQLGHLPPEPRRQRTPLLPVQCTGGYPVGDPGIRGRIPLAYRNGVRDGEKRRGAGRVRDPHLGWLASPCSPVPAGWSFSAEPATGLGGKKMPRITRPQVYRVVREMLPRERFGPEELLRWLEDTQDSNERARRSHAKRRAAMRASPHIPL